MTSDEKSKVAEQAYETAVKYELDYGCCPQCVLATVQETVRIGISMGIPGVSLTPGALVNC